MTSNKSQQCCKGNHTRQKRRQSHLSFRYKAMNAYVILHFLILFSISLSIPLDNDNSNNNNNDRNEHEDELFDDWLLSALQEIKGGGQTISSDRSKRSSSSSRSHHHHHHHHHHHSSSKSSQSSSSSSTDSSSPGDDGSFQKPVVVTIPNYGRVQGKREESIDFWGGIPYAAPPVGSLRFAPPETPQPWAPAKLDASHFGPDCWQVVDPLLNPTADINHMSEDCLYLNIFTPAGHAARSRQGVVFSGTKLLPVMVWFHGGAFQQGGARRPEYDGRRLAERDVIVVTINYRLGALGFMVSSQDGILGNFGLMDQRAAIDWVHHNIKAFGGDPDNITLFGESAGAVMIGLHLMMDGVGTLFHRAVMQSNPMGYQFRSVVVADFIGEALKRAVDCRDLECLRAERVEEIMRAQSSLMGVPRSVGDFFTWGPTQTQQVKVVIGQQTNSRFISRSDEHRLLRNLDNIRQRGDYFKEGTSESARWSAVNVSQPLKHLDLIPDDIPIMIGSNQHEGEMFVHSAFPAPMPKAVYWMFVGALFRDSAARVLKHYRGFVEQVEKEAEELARKQLEEEESKLFYLEHREQLDEEYEMLVAMNTTRRGKHLVENEGVESLVNAWSSGGGDPRLYPMYNASYMNGQQGRSWWNPFDRDPEAVEEARRKRAERAATKARLREERREARKRERALKEAAKVVVDYRPVMSRIIDDYLFRCPTWHYAHLLNQGRERRGKHKNNVYAYRFSHSTHVPGYKECWGKSCHTAELPYVFQAMDVIRSNYSTLSPFAQNEAPQAPSYPFSDILAAYRGALEAFENDEEKEERDNSGGENAASKAEHSNHTHSRAFQRILTHFFGDYFKEDADEEIASDMAERWANFARNGDPNYDGSRAKWRPWRHHSVGELESDYWMDESDDGGDDNPWVADGEYDYWSDFEISEFDEEDLEVLDDEDREVLAQEKQDRAYRRRALVALNMEVVDEDVFRTELRRITHRGGDNDIDKSFLASKLLFQKSLRWSADEHPGPSISKRAAKEAIRIAREIGVLGTGLSGEDRSWLGDADLDWDDDFFPELFDLRWPPEGRLIERDCTCDLWDKIRYRY